MDVFHCLQETLKLKLTNLFNFLTSNDFLYNIEFIETTLVAWLIGIKEIHPPISHFYFWILNLLFIFLNLSKCNNYLLVQTKIIDILGCLGMLLLQS